MKKCDDMKKGGKKGWTRVGRKKGRKGNMRRKRSRDDENNGRIDRRGKGITEKREIGMREVRGWKRRGRWEKEREMG